MKYLYIGLFLACTVVVISVGVGGYRFVRRKLFEAKSFLGSNIIKEGLELHNEIAASTPKSVSGMTKIYLPRILEDFPDFDYGYFRQLTENTIQNIFCFINGENVDFPEYFADSLKEQIEQKVKDLRKIGTEDRYENIRIHKTEIMKYEKNSRMYAITFQSAFEYIISGRKQQARYNIELAYIQDEEKAKKIRLGPILSTNCPNCGAPVKAVHTNCEYCGSLLTAINIRTWKYIRFYEVY